jgi:type IX secretion system PorP/SprF family membrane protein
MKIINKIKTALCAATLIASVSQAQQIPVFNNYTVNPYLINPARAGSEDGGRINFSVRKQWVNMPSGPLTNYGTFDIKFKNTNVGFGAYAYHDMVHKNINSNSGGGLTYAYHIPFNKEKTHFLSVGLSAGIYNLRNNFNDAIIIDEEEKGFYSATSFDLAAGINYHFKGLNVGFAVPQILGNNLKFKDNSFVDNSNSFGLSRHYLLSASYLAKFGKNKSFSLEPIVLLKKVETIPMQFDINLMFNWKDMLWAGAGYRSGSSFTKADAAGMNFSIGTAIKERVRLTYTIQMPLAKDNRSDFGLTHEATVGFQLGKRLKEAEKRLDGHDEDIDKLNKGLGETKEELEKTKEEVAQQGDQINQNTTNINELGDKIENTNNDLNKLINEMATKQDLVYKKVGSVGFELDEYTLTEDAKAKLDAFVNTIKTPKNNYFVYLAGSASKEASDTYNLVLSTKRADAVKKYLESKGITNPILIMSYGENSPINDQADEPEKSENRRVDIYLSGE